MNTNIRILEQRINSVIYDRLAGKVPDDINKTTIIIL